MATTEFKLGDEVEHKSGSDMMIIEEQNPDDGSPQAGWYVVSWFDGNNKPQRETYPAHVLKAWEPRTPFGITSA